MSDVIKFNVEVDETTLNTALQDLITDDVMLQIQNLFAKTINPWVPFLEGPLSQTLEITPEYVRYLQPYAHYQYVGDNFNHTIDYHPLASARWDKVAMQTELESFEQQIQDILARRARDLYG